MTLIEKYADTINPWMADECEFDTQKELRSIFRDFAEELMTAVPESRADWIGGEARKLGFEDCRSATLEAMRKLIGDDLTLEAGR